jgi:hypothetical protein
MNMILEVAILAAPCAERLGFFLAAGTLISYCRPESAFRLDLRDNQYNTATKSATATINLG